MAKSKKVNPKEILEKAMTDIMSMIGSLSSYEIKEEEDTLVVNINAGDETGLLIGRHGETVNSLQTILALILRQKLGEWKRVLVNVGDWREKQEDKLKVIAEQAAQRAIETGEAQPIYNLTAAQRRIIHMELSENKEVATESTGEGKDRYLVVKLKSKD
jgi:spoIIIJ-associated protein